MSFRLYDGLSKENKEKKDADASSLYEAWVNASRKKDDGEELLKFYLDLHHSKDMQPHWNRVYQALANELAAENLEFFAANLARMKDKKFTVKQWKEFCEKWFQFPSTSHKDIPAPSDIFVEHFGMLSEKTPVNLTATQLEPLVDLNKEIARKYTKDKDVINFNNTHVQLKADHSKVFTGNQILMLAAKQLLVFVNRDKCSAIDEVLKEVKEDKKPEKAKKKK